MELKYCFVIVCMLSCIIQTSCEALGDSYEIQLLGLFTTTNCHKEYEFECHNAKINRDTMRKLHQSERNNFSASVYTCFKDVQNNSRILANIVLPLTTEERTYYQMKCDNAEGAWQTSTERIIIFSYLSYDLTRFLSSLILPLESIILISVTDKPIYPAYYGENSRSIYSYEAGFGFEMHKDIIETKNEMNVTYMAFLNLYMGNQTLRRRKSTKELCKLDPSLQKWCLYINLNPEDCFKELDVDVTNKTAVQDTLELLRQYGITFLVVAGYQNSYHTFTVQSRLLFLNSKGFFHLPLISISSDIDFDRNPRKTIVNYNSENILTNFHGALQLNSLFRYAFRLPGIIIEEANKQHLDDGIKFLFDNFIFKNEAFKVIIQKYLPGKNLTYDTVKSLVSNPLYKSLFSKTMTHNNGPRGNTLTVDLLLEKTLLYLKHQSSIAENRTIFRSFKSSREQSALRSNQALLPTWLSANSFLLHRT